MNLAFNFKDQLFWIHNFLPINLYKKMYIDIIKNRNKLNFKKSKVNWLTYKEEEENMSESYLQDKSEQLNRYLKKYHIILKHQPFVDLMSLNSESHLRKYKYNQHLTWHCDTDKEKKRKYAATFYFNKTWRESWGGELMFKSNEGSGFIPIVGNSVVLVKTGLRHKVNPNLKKTHYRFSIQTWLQ
jgi:Rps23 Pro-64 3,4-dihydroxylase Tpa1-like proline 4-hydroxylase